MKYLCAALLLLLSASLGLSGSPRFAQDHSAWDGVVTDTHCGTHCQRTSAMTPDRECVRRCVRNGSKYGLWHGNHVYLLEPQSEAARFAAENVRVTGDLSGNTIHIKSIFRVPQQKPQVGTVGSVLCCRWHDLRFLLCEPSF